MSNMHKVKSDKSYIRQTKWAFLVLHCIFMRSGCRDIGCQSLCSQKILCTQDFGKYNQAGTVREQFPVKEGQLCPTLNQQQQEKGATPGDIMNDVWFLPSMNY